MGTSASKALEQNKRVLREQVLVGELSNVEIVDDANLYPEMVDVFVGSFTTPPADPMFSWMVEDATLAEDEQRRRLEENTRFMIEWVNSPLMKKGIFLVVRGEGNKIVGAASLCPPGVQHVDSWTFATQIVTIGMPPVYKNWRSWGPLPAKKFEQFDRVEAAKKEVREEVGDAWLLQTIGVSKSHHGKGLGGALMRAVCKLADLTQFPAYLDTESEWHEKFYGRFGFEAARKLEMKVEDAPDVRPQPEFVMLRKPQALHQSEGGEPSAPKAEMREGV